MQTNKRYVDIRSNGGNVIGRVHDSTNGEENIITFKGPTRAHMLKKLKQVYPSASSICFNRRGITKF